MQTWMIETALVDKPEGRNTPLVSCDQRVAWPKRDDSPKSATKRGGRNVRSSHPVRITPVAWRSGAHALERDRAEGVGGLLGGEPPGRVGPLPDRGQGGQAGGR